MLVNKLDAAWRAYSPGGKRKKMIKIPFNGKYNSQLRAMGTKRIPVVSSKFSYAQQGISINYDRPMYAEEPLYSYEEDYSPFRSVNPMPPMGYSSNPKLGQRQRQPLRTANQTYRSVIDTSREIRGWKRELDPVRSALRGQRLDLNRLSLRDTSLLYGDRGRA